MSDEYLQRMFQYVYNKKIPFWWIFLSPENRYEKYREFNLKAFKEFKDKNPILKTQNNGCERIKDR